MIRIHHILEKSCVNGPGSRFVIWTQGCPFYCKGCFNPKTHSLDEGSDMSIQNLADMINSTKNIRGITFTGGEPLIQTESILALLKLIDKKFDILLFSGYTFDEIRLDAKKMDLLKQIDAALLGRYNQKLKHPFFGKKLVLRGDRIQKDELRPWLNTEMTINQHNVSLTGLY